MKRIIFIYVITILLTGCVSNHVEEKEKEKTSKSLLSSYKIPRVLNDGNCAIGCPSGGGEVTIQRQIYTLNNNNKTKFANWVAYVVRKDTLGSGKPRNWKKDPDLGDDLTLSPIEYKGANKALGVDRGHQAPLASLAGLSDWRALNYLSNITPQKSFLNQGAWVRLEEQERKLAQQGHAVFVVTGTLYEKYIGKLPNAKKDHTIPSGYWKVIFLDGIPSENNYAAFIMNQDTPKNASYCQYQVSIKDVENKTGLNFWNLLDDNYQRKIKSVPGGLAKKMGCQVIPQAALSLPSVSDR